MGDRIFIQSQRRRESLSHNLYVAALFFIGITVMLAILVVISGTYLVGRGSALHLVLSNLSILTVGELLSRFPSATTLTLGIFLYLRGMITNSNGLARLMALSRRAKRRLTQASSLKYTCSRMPWAGSMLARG
jgi:hypothetical protein